MPMPSRHWMQQPFRRLPKKRRRPKKPSKTPRGSRRRPTKQRLRQRRRWLTPTLKQVPAVLQKCVLCIWCWPLPPAATLNPIPIADADKKATLEAEAEKLKADALKEAAEAKEAAERKAKEVAEAEAAEYQAAQTAFEHRRIQFEQKKQEKAEAKALAEIELQTMVAKESEEAAKALQQSLGLHRLMSTPLTVFAQLASEQLNDLREARSEFQTKELAEQQEAKMAIGNVELAIERAQYRYDVLKAEYEKEIVQFDIPTMQEKKRMELGDKRFKESCASRATTRANNAADKLHSATMDNNNKRHMIEALEKKIQQSEAAHAQAIRRAEMDGKAKKGAAMRKKHEEEGKIETESKALAAAKLHYHQDRDRFHKSLNSLEHGLNQDTANLHKAARDKEAYERKLLDLHEMQAAQKRQEDQVQREISALKGDVDSIKTRAARTKFLNPESQKKGRLEKNPRSGIDAPTSPPLQHRMDPDHPANAPLP